MYTFEGDDHVLVRFVKPSQLQIKLDLLCVCIGIGIETLPNAQACNWGANNPGGSLNWRMPRTIRFERTPAPLKTLGFI